MITREQFLELSSSLYIAQSHNLDSFEFEGNLLSCEIAVEILDAYREINSDQITETGKIPDRIAKQIKL